MLLCAAAAFLAAGCTQIDSELVVKEDRSASAEVSYILTEKVVEQFKLVFEATARLAEPVATDAQPANAPAPSAMRVFLDPDEPAIKQYLSTLEPYGITASDVRVRKSSGRRTVRFKLAFSDLAKAVTAPPLHEAGLRFGRTSDGKWELVREGRKDAALMSPSALAGVTPFLTGFTARIKVKTPGPVLESTAPRKSSKAVVWEFDFNRAPESAEQVFSSPLRVVYSL